MSTDAHAHTAFASGYRTDIDGLRAVAVLAVIFFHAHFWPFAGGFVGVDVFFVISGFLITSIIKKELDRNDFSIAKFYERRIRRIFPALFFLLLGVTPIALLVLLPVDTIRYGETVIATALFAANLYFWRTAGYFAPDAESNPLLHTWSLAVEEQFYIFFPIFLLVLLRWGNRRTALIGIAIVALLSLMLAEWQLGPRPTTVFYLLPTRAWELLLGSALAIAVLPSPSRIVATVLGAIGLLMIAAAVVLYSRYLPFPGSLALAPCIGTALVLYAGQCSDGPIARALSFRPVRFVGQISYSLYLWHLPPLVLARIHLGRDLTTLESWTLIAVATLIAALSWKYIEAPFRRPGKTDIRWRVIGAGVSASIVFSALGLALVATDGVAARYTPAAVAADAVQRGEAYPASCAGPNAASGPNPCIDTPIDILVWGDSHAAHYFAGIEQRAAAAGLRAQLQWGPGCPPVLGAVPVSVPRAVNEIFRPPGRRDEFCPALNDEVLATVRANPAIRTVVLAGAWNFWAEGLDLATGEGRYLAAPDAHDYDIETTRALLRQGLTRTIAELRQLGIEVVLLGQVPDNPTSPSECLARAYDGSGNIAACGRPLDTVLARTAWSDGLLDELGADTEVTVFDPLPRMCAAERCLVEAEGQPLYRDADHLSPQGSRFVADALPPDIFDKAIAPARVGSN